MIEQYIATWVIQGSDVSVENIQKSLIRWEGHVGEVFREMRIMMDRQKQGQIFPNDPHWGTMYERLVQIEERRESRKARRGQNVVANYVGDSCNSSSGSTLNPVDQCKACGPDYVPETPSSSSDDSGYFYDPCNLD